MNFSMKWGLGSHYAYGDYPKMNFNWEKLAWHLPLKDIDRESGLNKVDVWHDWLDHPGYDNYWKEIDVNKHYHQIKTPAYISGGWYDQYSHGTLENFSGMKAHAGSDKARKFTRCIIGPWTHKGALVEGMGLGDSVMLKDIEKIRNRFRENILKNPEIDPVPDEPALKYFMMGLNEWRESATWPIEGIRKTEYYLHSMRGANTRFGDGSLNKETPVNELPDTFIYDPGNPVPTNGGCVLTLPSGVFDQSKIEERSDILVFSTDLLAENVEVAGNVRLTLFASSNTPDTDFTVKLIDVYPDGRALNICDGIIRARYRKSMTKSEFLKGNQIYEYDIDCWETANCFRMGHQIRIEVSSSNFPRFDRNPNTGHKVGIDDELRIAKQTIYHDKKHPSRLILPVLTR